MNKSLTLFAAAVLAASTALPMQASAELEELQVHGQIRIRGNYLDPGFGRNNIGNGDAGFDDDVSADSFYNALVEVNFTADMSDDVTGYIALRSYDIYGDDSDDSETDSQRFDNTPGAANGATGFLAGSGNDTVGVYQAYIQADNVGGYPISVKIGRQEISLGREFLLGNNDDGVFFSGMAFDALLATYDNDESFRVTAFTAKLAETRAAESDGDIDLRGVYATYYGLEMLDVDAYWIWVDNGVGDTTGAAGRLGDDSENLHTLGVRVYGVALDDRLEYNVEFAYQIGDVNAGGPGALAAGPGPANRESLDVQAFAVNALVGYTFDDVDYSPEVHFEWAWFSGDDNNTDDDFEQFTRLFSDVHYGKINLGGNFDELATNMNIFRIGGSAQATDTVTLNADVLFFILDEDDATGNNVFGRGQSVGTGGVPNDNDGGTEIDLWATWQYSEDLTLSGGWSHFFTDDAEENAFGGEDDDLDYLWWQAHLVF